MAVQQIRMHIKENKTETEEISTQKALKIGFNKNTKKILIASYVEKRDTQLVIVMITLTGYKIRERQNQKKATKLITKLKIKRLKSAINAK